MRSSKKALNWWMGTTLTITVIAYAIVRWLTPNDPFYRAPDSELFLGISDIGRTDVLTALVVAAWLAATATFLSRKGSTLWLFSILAFYLVPTLFAQLDFQTHIGPATLIPWEAMAHGLDLNLARVDQVSWAGAALEIILLLSPGFANLGKERFGFSQVVAITLLTGSITFATSFFGSTLVPDGGVSHAALGFISYSGYTGAGIGPKWPLIGFASLYSYALFGSGIIALIVLATGAIGHATRSLGNS